MGLFNKKDHTKDPLGGIDNKPLEINPLDKKRLDKLVELAKFEGIKNFILLWTPEEGLFINHIQDVRFKDQLEMASLAFINTLNFGIQSASGDAEGLKNLSIFLADFKEILAKSNSRFKIYNDKRRKQEEQEELRDIKNKE